MRKVMLAGAAFMALAGSVQAAGVPHAQADAQALELAQKAIALRSVAGPGNQTPAVAALYRQALVDGGFPADQAIVTRVGDTAYLIARWPGTDRSLKPLVINGHMDVVEARPADWTRNPFKPVVEGGYLFGRGATDMKLDGTLAIAAVLALKRDGYTPRRDIVFAFSGDEETTMRTGAILAQTLSGAQMMLNMDGGGGVLDETTGAPEYFTWKAAEKTYADYRLTVTNPGGHSSEPRRPNAIDELAAALLRIQDHVFTPELSPLTRAYFEQAAKYERPRIAAAMRAFAANPSDPQAIATLRAEPSMIGKIGTTCVVTEISGGHALNALPQRAEANINCRIYPGHPRPAIMAELQQAGGDPAIDFRDVTEGSVATEASPINPEVSAAVAKALNAAYPGTPVFPSMSSGASDSMWFRYRGVPSYNISPLFTKASENFSHGLNERTPLADIAPSITYCMSLFKDLSS